VKIVRTVWRWFSGAPAGQNLGLALTLFCVGLLLTVFGERMPLADGLGYDGIEYGDWAMRLDALLDGRIPVSAYRVFRMLPSALAHGTLRLLGAGLTPDNVIRFFEVYNLGLLCLAALAWGGTADALDLGGRGKLLGFLGLFANHAVLKFNFYYPVLTDVSGYACAVFLLWAFVRSRPWLAVLITLAGTFCWPPLLLYGAIVLLFPRRDQVPGEPSRLAGTAAAILAAGGYGVLAATPLTGLTPHYPLAVAMVMVYLGGAAFCLFGSPCRVRPMLRRATTPGRLAIFAAAAVLAAVARLLIDKLVAHSGESGFFNLPLWQMVLAYLRTTCVPLSARFPGEFLVAHVLYFGPLLFLTGLFPIRVGAAAGRLGLGLLALTAAAAGHAVMPLSRQWLAGYPALVLVTVMAVRNVPLTRGFWAVFVGLSLLLSKVWLLFNLTPPLAPGTGPGGDAPWTPGFSFEHYVSSTGRWMSFDWYFVQGVLLAAIFVCLYWYFHAPRCPAPPVGRRP
jgi:hypothetical protein